MNNKWHLLWTREYGLLRMEGFARGGLTLKRYVGFNLPDWLIIWNKGNAGIYLHEEDYQRFMRALAERGLKKLSNYYRLKNIWLEDFQYFRYLARMLPHNFNHYPNQRLTKLLKQFMDWNTRANPGQLIGFHLAELASDRMTDLVAGQARKLGLKDYEKIINTLTQPLRANTPVLLDKALLELAVAIKKDKITSFQKKRVLRKIYGQFYWLPCNDPIDRPYELSDFEHQLEKYLTHPSPAEDLLKLEKEWRTKRRKWLHTLERLQPNSREREFARIFAMTTYWKDRRDDYRRETYARFRNLFAAIAQRVGVTATTLQYFKEEEIRGALLTGKKLSRGVAENRRSNAVTIFNGEVFKILNKHEGKQLVNSLETIRKKTGELTGVIGSQGIASGEATIIWIKDDLKKVRKGQIMVAKTTHPDYVPAMRLCRAIVTDEGGITSHAAIVARELGIPCVVGTKIATKVFKDGDRVEVDAGKGVVKKI